MNLLEQQSATLTITSHFWGVSEVSAADFVRLSLLYNH